jgi:hypothetical protein
MDRPTELHEWARRKRSSKALSPPKTIELTEPRPLVSKYSMPYNAEFVAIATVAIFTVRCGGRDAAPRSELPEVKGPAPTLRRPMTFTGYVHWDCAPNDASNALTIHVAESDFDTIPAGVPHFRIFLAHAGPPEHAHRTLRWPGDEGLGVVQRCRFKNDCTRVTGRVTFGEVKLNEFVEGEIDVRSGVGANVLRGRFNAQWAPRYNRTCFGF